MCVDPRNGIIVLTAVVDHKEDAAVHGVMEMCIRDRQMRSVCSQAMSVEPEPPKGSSTTEFALEPVSYTHLDVYKRQYHTIPQSTNPTQGSATPLPHILYSALSVYGSRSHLRILSLIHI